MKSEVLISCAVTAQPVSTSVFATQIVQLILHSEFEECSFLLCVYIVEQISWAIFQGGGLLSTTYVSIYQYVRIGL